MNKRGEAISALKAIILFTFLLGILYPLFITAIGQLFFYSRSSGSVIVKNNSIVGSKLIGQKFESDIYFSSRPSAIDYNPIPSGASNYSPTDARLKRAYEERIKLFAQKNKISPVGNIPSEMLFASGSGVDPHISKQSALLQIKRIASVRNLDEIEKEKLRALVNSYSTHSIFGLFGDEYINVLELNLKLDELLK